MAPLLVTMKKAPSGRRLVRPGSVRYDLGDPIKLSADSNLPTVQAVIREGIRQGIVRVLPIPGSFSHVRVILVQIGPLANVPLTPPC